MSQLDRHILYAEDEETDAFLFQRAFRRAGITDRLVVVPNGQAAMDHLTCAIEEAASGRHSLPLLVLLDVNMPAVSGFEVLQWIRATPAIASLSIIMLSSSQLQADIHRAYLYGANGYLVKPTSVDECLSMAKTMKDWLTRITPVGEPRNYLNPVVLPKAAFI